AGPSTCPDSCRRLRESLWGPRASFSFSVSFAPSRASLADRSYGGRESAPTSLVPEAAPQPGTRPLIRPSLRTIGWALSPHHKGRATTMGRVTGQSVGNDVSEDFLDVHLHPAGKDVRLARASSSANCSRRCAS